MSKQSFWLAIAAAFCISVIVSMLLHPTASTQSVRQYTTSATHSTTPSPDIFANPPSNATRNGFGLQPPPALDTKGYGSIPYSQTGILVSGTGADALILPLFGRKMDRDRYQYYTLSNTGSVNTKLPVRTKNRRCSGEYGCDEIVAGDEVFVEGYSTIFLATIYDSMQYTYSV